MLKNANFIPFLNRKPVNNCQYLIEQNTHLRLFVLSTNVFNIQSNTYNKISYTRLGNKLTLQQKEFVLSIFNLGRFIWILLSKNIFYEELDVCFILIEKGKILKNTLNGIIEETLLQLNIFFFFLKLSLFNVTKKSHFFDL